MRMQRNSNSYDEHRPNHYELLYIPLLSLFGVAAARGKNTSMRMLCIGAALLADPGAWHEVRCRRRGASPRGPVAAKNFMVI